jgi:hypothetical protein
VAQRVHPAYQGHPARDPLTARFPSWSGGFVGLGQDPSAAWRAAMRSDAKAVGDPHPPAPTVITAYDDGPRLSNR